MTITIEYDDGRPIELKGAAAEARHKLCTPRGRPAGFYMSRSIDDKQFKIPIGYLRVSEMKRFETELNTFLGG